MRVAWADDFQGVAVSKRGSIKDADLRGGGPRYLLDRAKVCPRLSLPVVPRPALAPNSTRANTRHTGV